jgi:hypothetical protein
MEILKKFWGYITFKKSDNPDKNVNLKLMHGINRITIIMFILGMIFLISKYLS